MYALFIRVATQHMYNVYRKKHIQLARLHNGPKSERREWKKKRISMYAHIHKTHYDLPPWSTKALPSRPPAERSTEGYLWNSGSMKWINGTTTNTYYLTKVKAMRRKASKTNVPISMHYAIEQEMRERGGEEKRSTN